MSKASLGCFIVVGALAQVSQAFPQAGTAAAGPSLGSAHFWMEGGEALMGGAASDEWGVDREGYLALEGYAAVGHDEWHWGGEIGITATDDAVDDDGDRIRDFGFWWVEFNSKKAFPLSHGFVIDVGMGTSLFYVSGHEIDRFSGSSDPLADVGFGFQAFSDFTWRRRGLLLGLDVEYQYALDLLNIDYSSLRFGGHLGFCI